jgi:hypothetical protein
MESRVERQRGFPSRRKAWVQPGQAGGSQGWFPQGDLEGAHLRHLAQGRGIKKPREERAFLIKPSI